MFTYGSGQKGKTVLKYTEKPRWLRLKNQTFSYVKKRELVNGLALVKESSQGNAALSSCILLGMCPCVLGAQNEKVLLVKFV